MERHQLIEAMTSLKLYGMRASFDEIAGKGLSRREEIYPLLASLVRAELTHRQSPAIWLASSSSAHPAFVEARYADITLPSATLHEVSAARRSLLAKGRREVGAEAILRTVIAQRELIYDAVRKTSSQRKRGRAARNSKVDESGWGSLRGVDSSNPVPSVEDMD